jgi:hypothetical protein
LKSLTSVIGPARAAARRIGPCRGCATPKVSLATHILWLIRPGCVLLSSRVKSPASPFEAQSMIVQYYNVRKNRMGDHNQKDTTPARRACDRDYLETDVQTTNYVT